MAAVRLPHMQSYLITSFIVSLSHSCNYFFLSNLSSAIVLAFVLFIICCLVLSFIDFPIFFFQLLFPFGLLMFSTFCIFSISCAICLSFDIMVFLWLLFVCSANIFLATLLWSLFVKELSSHIGSHIILKACFEFL